MKKLVLYCPDEGKAISTKVNESVKGAEIVKTEWTADDGCIITLRLSKKRLAQMLKMKLK